MISKGFESEPPVSASINYSHDRSKVVLVEASKVSMPGLVGSIPVVAGAHEDHSESPTRF